MNVWFVDPLNPNSKYGVWSTTNPTTWLNANGYSGQNGDPCGYGPIKATDPVTTIVDSNMPDGLADLVAAQGGRASMMSPADGSGADWVLGDQHGVSFYATTNSSGAVSIYGWIDNTDWTGSAHMPLNGFMVIPEPATGALLGLGGLALLRRKRA